MNEEMAAGEEITVESSENAVEESESKKPYPSMGILSIRIIVGLYVLYNMYQVITSKGEKAVYLYVIVALLSVVALALVGTSLVHYIKGEYSGGKADKNKNSN